MQHNRREEECHVHHHIRCQRVLVHDVSISIPGGILEVARETVLELSQHQSKLCKPRVRVPWGVLVRSDIVSTLKGYIMGGWVSPPSSRAGPLGNAPPNASNANDPAEYRFFSPDFPPINLILRGILAP